MHRMPSLSPQQATKQHKTEMNVALPSLRKNNCSYFLASIFLPRSLITTFLIVSAWFTEVLIADVGEPRNVVFILADDLGWGDLGCYGQTKIATPNIDRLAREGMRFTRHYSGAPVCAPSRCVLMTGKHLGHAEIRGNKQAKTVYPEFTEGQLPISSNALTIAKVFQNAGYRTGAFGKWGLGPVGSSGSPEKQGFHEFFGYNCQAVAHSYYPAKLWHNTRQVTINEVPVPGHSGVVDGEVLSEKWQGKVYAPHRMLEEARKFLEQNKAQPFFLYLPFIEPHVAMHPPQASLDRFSKDWDTEPYRGGNGYLPHASPRAAYAAMVSDLDGYVGSILDALTSHGLEKKTLVIFTSDNGATHPQPRDPKFHVGGADIEFFQSTGGLKGHKGSVYEGGIRVPLIARLPGVIPEGTTSDALTYFADWFSTLLEATGLVAPQLESDGESFWKHLTGTVPTWKRTKPMVWVFPEYTGQVAIQSDGWKLVRRQLSGKSPGAWELYDLNRDEAEMSDVADKHPERVQAMATHLRSEMADNAFFPVRVP
jgi:arylsulfatase A